MPHPCDFYFNQKDLPLKLDKEFNRIFNSADAIGYHSKLRCYQPTPLIKMPRLAKSLGIKELYVKDESKRFLLNTFKVLGASFAVHKVKESLQEDVTFCTATDGNHGRSLAWATRRLKQKAVIYIPAHSAIARIKNIKKYRASVVLVDGDYDATVKRAREDSEKFGYTLIQDTSWEGYTEIPTYITAGYKTMMIEMEDSLHKEKEPGVDFVFMQSGVGTWASCVAAYYHNRYPGKMPKLVTVEPNESDALLESSRQMNLTKTKAGQQTIMAGLNCGTPSVLAWDILKDAVDLFISIPDEYAVRAIQYLYYPFTKDRQVFAGESGAAGLAGLMALASDDSLKEAKKRIGLNKTSRVLVFNTEGVTDPESFDELIQQELEI